MGKVKVEDKILKIVLANPEKLTTLTDFTRFVKQTLKSDSSVEALRYHVKKVAEANNFKFQPDIDVTVGKDLDKYRVKIGSREVDRLYTDLQGKYVAMEDQLSDLLQLEDVTLEALEVPVDADTLKGEGIPIVQWSDWHVSKTVDAATVNGLNEYNPEIAKQRALKLFENTAKMIDLHRKHTKITTGIIHLAGDSIEGYLRESSLRENTMTPIEEVIFAAELEITGLEHILSTGFFKDVFVLMNRGNHPRLTKKMDSDDYRMNLETLVHQMVIKHFEKEKKLHFVAPISDIGYFKIMDKTIRFFHGHQVKYNGGIGGLATPLRKAILNWDDTEKADYNMMGHFHQSYKPLSNVIMNGSLCGYDPFAMTIGRTYQPPLQSMEMLLEGKGFRMFTSIDCE